MITRGQLRDHFVGAGVKRLSAVDAEAARSHQHEIGTTRDMREQFLGEAGQEFKAVYIWINEEEEVLRIDGTATYYDVREHQEDRLPEWRLYYASNSVTDVMREGDALFLAKRTGDALYFVVAPAGSTGERQLSWLFGLEPGGQSFVSRQFVDGEPALDFAADWILESLEIRFGDLDTSKIDKIIETLGEEFPDTRKMADTARKSVAGVDAASDPDSALSAWLSTETAIFYRLEHLEIDEFMSRACEEISKTGTTDSEGFLKFSLRIHNRRRVRMGLSLENHLEAVFKACGISFDRNAVTGKYTPDFLFPGAEAYRDAPDTEHPSLVMLEAKSTCRERWLQIGSPVPKMPVRHFLTTDPAVSESQMNRMKASGIQLVMPDQIQKKYTEEQRAWIWNLAGFIKHVRKQAGG